MIREEFIKKMDTMLSVVGTKASKVITDKCITYHLDKFSFFLFENNSLNINSKGLMEMCVYLNDIPNISYTLKNPTWKNSKVVINLKIKDTILNLFL